MSLDESVSRLLDILRDDDGPLCSWCKNKNAPVQGKGLCAHCNRYRLRLQQVERRVAELEAQDKGIPFDLDFDLRVRRAAVHCCKDEGQVWGDKPKDPVSALDIEHNMSWFSKRVAGKDLFYGYAGMIEGAFTPDQRVVLNYFLDGIIRQWTRKNRYEQALNRATDHSHEYE